MLNMPRCLSFRALGVIAFALALSCIGSSAVSQAQTYTHGIDVSYWQGPSVNWSAVKNAGNDFAFIRATLGTLLVDDYLQTNRNGALATGMYVGFYHYGTLDQQVGPNDAFNEANHFVNNIEAIYEQGGNLLRPVIDVETVPGLGSISQDRAYVSQWVRNFISVVKDRIGVDPIIYCNTNYASNYFESDLTKYGLWVANYNYAPPTVPPTSIDGVWNGWDFWQYTQTGRVNGVSGNVDRNVYNGTLSQMIEEFSVGTAPTPNADFNGDGVTDGNDFLIWQRNYTRIRSNATFAQGDANRDGFILPNDLQIWKAAFGLANGTAAAGAVPEPTAVSLLVVGAIAGAVGVRVRRRRR